MHVKSKVNMERGSFSRETPASEWMLSQVSPATNGDRVTLNREAMSHTASKLLCAQNMSGLLNILLTYI